MTYLLLLTALVLSAIAAFYAVAGLVAIFAASAVSIMVMGGALETAKLVVASWLYRNWKEIPVLMKTYFTVALLILMMLTSMGIFGYLSKAHLDQAVPTGDISAKLNLIDEKIKTQKENIDAARKQLSQLDLQVDQTLNRTTEASGVDRSVQIRRSQTKERANIYREIETSQTEIAKLNQERAPIATEVRKVEAEVGPIKYIAALLYGDTLNDNLLESAVRIVIIMIVLVFDPLAVLMLIAWNREQRKNEDPFNDPGVKEFFRKGKEVARSLDEQADLPAEAKKDTTVTEDPTIDRYAYLKTPWVSKVPGIEPVGPQVYVPEPLEEKSNDWEPELYARVEVPKNTQDFLNTVETITQQPVEPTIQLTQESPFSAKETEFTLNTDIHETLEKPTNGRPDKYK